MIKRQLPPTPPPPSAVLCRWDSLWLSWDPTASRMSYFTPMRSLQCVPRSTKTLAWAPACCITSWQLETHSRWKATLGVAVLEQQCFPFTSLFQAKTRCVTSPKGYPKPRVFMRSGVWVLSQAVLRIPASQQSEQESDSSPLPPAPSPGNWLEPPRLAMWAPKINGQL